MHDRETTPKSIVMLHGGPGFHGYMDTLGAQLPRHHHITCFAQPGSPANPRPSDALTIRHHLAEIDRIVDRLPPHQDVVLTGHSWGANLALLYAAQSGERLSRVVAISPAPLNAESGARFEANLRNRLSERTTTRLAELDQRLNAAVQSGQVDQGVQNAFHERLRIVMPAYHFDASVNALIRPIEVDVRSFAASQQSLWDLISSGEVPTWLDNVRVPVLHLHGENDPIPHRSVGSLLAKHLSDYRRKTFGSCGHFPWLEPAAQEMCINALVEFLDH